MRKVFIAWSGNSEVLLGRIVLDPSLKEAAMIRALAARLKVPVVDGQTPLQAHDLWVGISPKGGWGELAGETMWARSAEAGLITARLERAKVTDARWAIEFSPGVFFQNLETNQGGPVAMAQRFESKVETASFIFEHRWIFFNGGKPKDIG